MSRQDQYNVTLTIGDVDWGTWDKLNGGEIDSEELKYKPGGMGAQLSLGGSQEVGNITVSRLYELVRDHNQIGVLITGVGKLDVTVNRQPLDVDGVSYGSPIVYTGKLKALTLPEVDSESSDAALVELEITPSGSVVTA